MGIDAQGKAWMPLLPAEKIRGVWLTIYPYQHGSCVLISTVLVTHCYKGILCQTQAKISDLHHINIYPYPTESWSRLEDLYLATYLHKAWSNLISMIFLHTCHIWLKLAVALNALWGEWTERQLPNACSFLGLHFCRTEIQLKLLRHVFRFLQKALSRCLDSTVQPPNGHGTHSLSHFYFKIKESEL